MGSGGGPSLASLASIGLSASSKITAAAGTQAADDAQSDRLERAAEYGRTAASQTGAQMTMNLNQTLGNIDAMRAAAHDDPTSPTGAAVRDLTQQVGNEKTGIAVDNILGQTEQDESDAAYMRQAGAFALTQGKIGAVAGVLGSISGTNFSSFGLPGGGSSGGGSSSDPEG